MSPWLALRPAPLTEVTEEDDVAEALSQALRSHMREPIEFGLRLGGPR